MRKDRIVAALVDWLRIFKHIQTIIYHCCYCEFYLVTLLLLVVAVVEAAIRVAVAVVYCNSSYSCCHYSYYHRPSKTILLQLWPLLLCSCYIWGFDATAYSQPFCRVYNKLSCRQISERALTSRLATIGKPSLMQSTLSQFKSITCLSLSLCEQRKFGCLPTRCINMEHDTTHTGSPDWRGPDGPDCYW